MSARAPAVAGGHALHLLPDCMRRSLAPPTHDRCASTFAATPSAPPDCMPLSHAPPAHDMHPQGRAQGDMHPQGRAQGGLRAGSGRAQGGLLLLLVGDQWRAAAAGRLVAGRLVAGSVLLMVTPGVPSALCQRSASSLASSVCAIAVAASCFASVTISCVSARSSVSSWRG